VQQNDAVLQQLDSSDAIIFGSPTFMGGPAAQFKAFADATVAKWFGQEPTDIKPSTADKLTGEILGRRVASFVLKAKQ
jgi:multimeric flavodoxin WrbA